MKILDEHKGKRIPMINFLPFEDSTLRCRLCLLREHDGEKSRSIQASFKVVELVEGKSQTSVGSQYVIACNIFDQEGWKRKKAATELREMFLAATGEPLDSDKSIGEEFDEMVAAGEGLEQAEYDLIIRSQAKRNDEGQAYWADRTYRNAE